MFVLRAMFWIAAVTVLAPPAPGAAANREPAAIANFRTATLSALARVKVEVEDELGARRRDPA